MPSPQRHHLRGLHVNPKGGCCEPLARWAEEGPGRLIAYSHRGQREDSGLPSLPSVSPHPRLLIGLVATLGRMRPLPESVPEPVLLQGPSTSSPNTAATVTWWTTCTATSTPSCSAIPTSHAHPVLSSTAMPCQWGSPYPGMREGAPSEYLPSIWALVFRSTKMRV